jgi:hypothetical protein
MEKLNMKMSELDGQSAIQVEQVTAGRSISRAVFQDAGVRSTRVEITGSDQASAANIRAFVQDCIPT